AIRVERQGAFFKLTQNKKLVWNVLATDLDFGPDSSLYVADWVNGWEGLGRGRIYRLSHKQHGASEQVKEVHALLTGGFAALATARLIDLLGHADQRVRIGASIELASRRSEAKDGGEPGIARRLLDCASDSNRTRTQRLHAMWAFRMAARRGHVRAPKALFLQLIRDGDEEIRRAVLQWAGDLRRFDIDLAVYGRGLADRSARVQAAAALALYRVGRKFDDESRRLFAMSVRDLLADNADRDPVLRHACVMAWTGVASPQQIEQFGFEGSVPVRRAAIVALRRLRSPRVAKLLMHSSRLVREEAARAIYDDPIPEAMEQLAAALWRGVGSDAFTRRALAANYRLGDEASAERIATFLSRADCPASMREEAWSMLEHWARPSGRDRVLGMWRPILARTSRPAATAVQAHWDQWKSDTKVAPRAALVAVRVGLVVSLPYLVHAVVDASRPASYRAEALQAIDAHDARQGLNWARRLVHDSHAELRGVARRIMVDRAPIEALPLVIESVRSGTRRERQDALRLLGTLKHPSAEKELLRLFGEWTDGRLAPAIGLELLESVRHHATTFGSAELKRKLDAYEASRASLPLADRYRELQVGGDASRGRAVFFGDVRASCSRCHTIEGRGGLVGPDLTDVAKDKDRKQLLESIIDPNRTIAKGFETIALFIDDGRVITGIVRSEDQRQLVLIDADGRQMIISKESIEERHTTTSAMPQDMLKQLPPDVIRDLVEFLSARK
ncbi:MAG TPA: c-type cytochrome, partial [Planctomycetaceae bacterium]|nr:c-type cytochrome [Planctomycetaceae bacterium]